MHRFVKYAFFLTLGTMLISCFGVEKYGESSVYDHGTNWRNEIIVVMPPNAPYISQQFRVDEEKSHRGIDIWGLKGTTVLAAAPGTVIRSFFGPAYGNQIEILHETQENGDRISTIYAHLSSRLVEQGDPVKRGQKIGTMGNSGALGLLIHLHFETMRRTWHNRERPFDPHLVWYDGVGKVTCFDPNRSYDNSAFLTTFPVVCK